MPSKVAYAGFPAAVIYSDKALKKPVHQLLWGDRVTVKARDGKVATLESKDGDRFMKEAELQDERLLEIVFVDIGQGDGALVVTPDDRALVVDAGAGDNMVRFLKWRYRGFQQKFEFEAAVISHSDQDHYGGFGDLFEQPNVTVKRLFHNGLVERNGASKLGTRDGDLMTELVRDTSALKALLKVPANRGKKPYPNMLFKALEAGVVKEAQMLSVEQRFMPGFEGDKKVVIEVLGPVPETKNGKTGLRWLGDDGKTKNGHSVVLKLRYGSLSVLLGGDLNIASENILLAHHTGMQAPAKSAAEQKALIEAARKVFQVDIAKACHHGSSDVSLDFLSALNPSATVISSGDDEPHAHPRPEALGAIGATSRGPRPLLFSTELARSAPEKIKHPNQLKKQLTELPGKIAAETNVKVKAKLQKELDEAIASINRSVAVFGAINLRSDGKRAVLAYKLESSPKANRKWDLYPMVPDASGTLHYQSKHEEDDD